MSLRTPIFLFLVATALVSCATYGNKSLDDPKKYLNIREGKSTKVDVYDVFGQPHDVDYSNDGAQSMWSYFKVETSPNAWTYVPYLGLLASGTNEESTKVYFTFGSNQHLIRVQTAKKSDSENSWAGMARIASQGNKDERATHVAAEMARIGKPFDKKLAHKVKFVR